MYSGWAAVYPNPGVFLRCTCWRHLCRQASTDAAAIEYGHPIFDTSRTSTQHSAGTLMPEAARDVFKENRRGSPPMGRRITDQIRVLSESIDMKAQ